MRLALYGLTILVSAFLLFGVQPMVGKALLPLLGGVPGAWTACLLFFQAALLAGYAYVWLGARFAPLRVRVIVHVALVTAAALAFAPFAFMDGVPWLSAAEYPTAYALAFLGANVAVAFTLLSATAPLVSSWYAESGADRPYFLYAASNAGSLAALLAYPFVVEPFFDLGAQAAAFRVAFVVVAVGIAAAGAHSVISGGGATRSVPETDATLGWRRRATWVGLAFVPSVLLVGSTTYLSTDLAPLPLLWVVPLAIYLISFILAFSERIEPPVLLGRGACLIAVVLVLFTVSHANEPVWLIGLLHLLFLGAGSWLAHRRLADDAPHPAHLPEFYVWIAVGGVLGTLVSAVVAPIVLPDIWEYPAAIALACATRTKIGIVVDDRPWRQDIVHMAVVGGLVAGPTFIVPLIVPSIAPLIAPFFGPHFDIEAPLVALLSFGPAAIYTYRWMPLRRRYTLCLLAIVLVGGLTLERGARRLTTRSFFGVLRVVDGDDERFLLHGTTLHGSQRLSERDECEPHHYYEPAGPLGSLFASYRAAGHEGRIVGVGLGAGVLTCYAAPNESWRMVDINPEVIEIASDPDWFTYLRESPTDRIELSLGDGRVAIGEEDDASLSMILVDAFNSDSVPAHLLTREAMRLYLQKLRPGGWLVLHISNRVLDLASVVSNVVAAEGVAASLAEDPLATYVVVARDAATLRILDPVRFRPLVGGDPRQAWTDRFSSILSAMTIGSD